MLKKHVMIIYLAIGFLMFIGCNQTRTKQITNRPSDFAIDNAPLAYQANSNPLDYAANMINLDFDDFALPRANEGGYQLACRFPVIDYVSNRPLYMKQWVEDSSAQINTAHQERKFSAVGEVIAMLRESKEYPATIAIDETVVAEFSSELEKSHFTAKYKKELISLYRCYLTAAAMTDKGKADLSEEDLKFFNDNPAYFLLPDGKSIPSVTGNVASFFNFIEKARRVNFSYIFGAAKLLADGIQKYTDNTKDFAVADIYADPTKSKETFTMTVNSGLIIIGGFGNDTHKEDSPFMIDLGGNDIYTNNAGGSYYTSKNLAFSIDHAGNDHYNAPDKFYVQGFGFLGAGFLVDLAGNDEYTAKHFSQGVGVMGVGVIWDAKGDDRYDAHGFCQGAGMFGLGMIMESSGEDFYDCATMGQASATTLGFGILSDLAGDDRYQAQMDESKDPLGSRGYGTKGLSQGAGLSFRSSSWSTKLTAYGGVGLLTDQAGNDRYRAKHWCNQGGSYVMSLGALVDYNGNDHYSSVCSMGSSIHVTNAILIDKDGNDIYDGGFRNGGSGSDRSPGFLIDYRGNDIYGSSETNYEMAFGVGCKPLGFSLMIDYEGDDIYGRKLTTDAKRKGYPRDVFGGVWASNKAYDWPHGISLDLGGKDSYNVKNRSNDSERLGFGHGIHLDTTWKGGDVIGKIENPLEPYRAIPVPKTVIQSQYYKDIRLLQGSDVFTRFQAVGRLTSQSTDVLKYLVDALLDSPHRQYNRDLMECINYFFTRNQITDTELPVILKLLQAKDEEVRSIVAYNVGLWNMKNAEDELIKTVWTDKSGPVRRSALISLYRIKSEKGIAVAKKLIFNDKYFQVRRISAIYLGRLDKRNSSTILIKSIENDPHPAVKVSAAEAFTNFRDERALKALQTASKSENVFVRRAAAKGLITLYQKEGIKILIETLDYPSIMDYGQGETEFLSTYTGHSFPGNNNPSRDLWEKWFAENKDKFDLKNNVDSSFDIKELDSSVANVTEAEKFAKYEVFLEKYPEHTQAKQSLAKMLNAVAWDMVTASKETAGFQPEQGLIYAIRAVELNPDPNIIDTLAEAYFVNGNLTKAIEICRDILKKNPNNNMFKQRLEKHLKEQQELENK